MTVRMFPMTVQLPDGPAVTPCLILLDAAGGLDVYSHRQDYPHGTPLHKHVVRVLHADGVQVLARTSKALTVAWDGYQLSAVKDADCGCGHVLKRWRP